MTMYPQEHFVTPLDEQEAIERARQSRLRVIAAMQGPGEREYAARKVKPKPMPRLAKYGIPFVAAGVLISAWVIWPEAHAAIMLLSAVVLAIACTASIVAGPSPPKPE